MFTLYDAGEPVSALQGITYTIEQRFRQAALLEGPKVVEEIKVVGSRYSYRRNDRRLDGSYIDAKEARKVNSRNPANPFNQLDPVGTLQMSHLFGESAERLIGQWLTEQDWRLFRTADSQMLLHATYTHLSEEERIVPQTAICRS